MRKDPSVNVVIGGEAGQGLLTVGALIVKVLVRGGYEFLVTQDYLSRIRGGHNTYSVRFGPDPVLGPADEIDVLVALDEESIPMHSQAMTEAGVIIVDEKVATDFPRTFRVPFDQLAEKPIFRNTAALGVLASTICHDISLLEEILHEQFAKKGEEVLQENLKVLHAAYEWKSRQEHIFECPAPSGRGRGRLAINGNEAIAFGAAAAGANFCSYYPMTPSTSIPLTLIQHASKLGILAEQAEDEICAMNMAIGASYAGGRAVVATSGGGFALMTEGLSLAGMTETPLVVCLIMRPGPATGLPTRTEQGDLNLALYAGHGEFPRAILAPGTVEQCFQLGHKAFDLAEKHQSPVFVLSDQYLADSVRAVSPFDLDNLPPVARPILEPENPEDYLRYAWNEDTGVSPRVIPGFSEALVVADSDEHTPDGHITEDHGVRIAMVKKRNRKMGGILADVLPPAYDGPESPARLFVCWGSTYGPALEAVRALRKEGESIGLMHFSQVYPLNPDHFLLRLESASEVICVEGNHDGQFAGLLRKTTGFAVDRLITRYDGLPFSAGYILRALADQEKGGIA